MSDELMIVLCLEYLVLSVVCVVEGRWVMGVYWVAAAILNSAVLMLGKGWR